MTDIGTLRKCSKIPLGSLLIKEDKTKQRSMDGFHETSQLHIEKAAL
jgi:chorismate-pyruvate lyase